MSRGDANRLLFVKYWRPCGDAHPKQFLCAAHGFFSKDSGRALVYFGDVCHVCLIQLTCPTTRANVLLVSDSQTSPWWNSRQAERLSFQNMGIPPPAAREFLKLRE